MGGLRRGPASVSRCSATTTTTMDAKVGKRKVLRRCAGRKGGWEERRREALQAEAVRRTG